MFVIMDPTGMAIQEGGGYAFWTENPKLYKTAADAAADGVSRTISTGKLHRVEDYEQLKTECLQPEQPQETIDVLPLNSVVSLWTSDPDRRVYGTITGVYVRPGSVSYEVCYWSGSSLVSSSLNAALVTPGGPQRLRIGFKSPS